MKLRWWRWLKLLFFSLEYFDFRLLAPKCSSFGCLLSVARWPILWGSPNILAKTSKIEVLLGETSQSVWIGEFRKNNWVLAFHWKWKTRGSNFVGTFDWNWKIEKFLGSNFVWAFDWNILHQRLSTELRFKGKLPEKCRFCRRNISYFFLRVTGYFAI